MKAIIDRIIEQTVVLEFETGEIVYLPKSVFEFPIYPQMMVEIFITRNKKAEQKLRDDIKNLKNKLNTP